MYIDAANTSPNNIFSLRKTLTPKYTHNNLRIATGILAYIIYENIFTYDLTAMIIIDRVPSDVIVR